MDGKGAGSEYAGRSGPHRTQLLGHGKWMAHFRERFEPHGLKLRTAEDYMNLAREADSKIAKFANSARDVGARTIRAATKKAEAKLASISGREASRKLSVLTALPFIGYRSI